MSLSIDPKNAALLVMDFQTDIVGMLPTETNSLLARTAALVDAARKRGMRVIYIVIAFRAGYPELSPRNATSVFVRESGRFLAESAGTEVHAALAPRPDEVTVTKRRVSAFAGTDLEMVLRAGGIETLVLTGIVTSGVVLSTVRHAADADYRLVVVEDCCTDRDAEVHRVLMEKVFPRQAAIAKAEEVVKAIDGA
jgi:nicotinamidase-related amidase